MFRRRIEPSGQGRLPERIVAECREGVVECVTDPVKASGRPTRVAKEPGQSASLTALLRPPFWISRFFGTVAGFAVYF